MSFHWVWQPCGFCHAHTSKFQKCMILFTISTISEIYSDFIKSYSALTIFMDQFSNQGYLWTPHDLRMTRKIQNNQISKNWGKKFQHILLFKGGGDYTKIILKIFLKA